MGIKRYLAALALWIGCLPGQAAGEPFDYYVMALSWNASWCEADGDARGADQCDARHAHGFLLHGLWPQHEDGWPEHCSSRSRDPSRRETRAMADLFGSGGLAWHQWKKHGRCSGLSARNYFRLSREAYDRVRRPKLLRQLERAVRIDPEVVEAAFLEANPALSPDGVTVTCAGGRIREVRICLSRDLTPRACSASALRGCRADEARFPPMR